MENEDNPDPDNGRRQHTTTGVDQKIFAFCLCFSSRLFYRRFLLSYLFVAIFCKGGRKVFWVFEESSLVFEESSFNFEEGFWFLSEVLRF